MSDILQFVFFTLHDFIVFCQYQFTSRELVEWLFLFMPFYVMGEFPRYVFPSLYLFLHQWLGFAKDDTEQKVRFLESYPSISVLLVGYNEEESIAKAIDSLLELNYPDLEIIVVDDNSEDRMYEIAKPYADKGLIKLFKNTSATGRSGRPTASNLAFHISSGDFILSVDADTSFDRNTLLHMIGPFYDPKVGGVAGNLKARNIDASIWSRFQAIEYMISIGLWKRWLNLLGMNMQASGAFGAFRRKALVSVGAWDPELAEDADLSLKIKKIGWHVVFAPQAIAMTNVPETRAVLTSQRYRWDKGMLRTFFHKHPDIMLFWRYDWRNAFEMSLEYIFSVLLTFLYILYFLVMVVFYFKTLLFVLLISYVVYMLSALLVVAISLYFSERRDEEWPLIFITALFPFYKGYFRLVRFYALLVETLRVNYEENYLPQSAWRNTPKW